MSRFNTISERTAALAGFDSKHLAIVLIEEKWSGLFEQIFLIYKWKTCGFTLPLGPLAATR